MGRGLVTCLLCLETSNTTLICESESQSDKMFPDFIIIVITIIVILALAVSVCVSDLSAPTVKCLRGSDLQVSLLDTVQLPDVNLLSSCLERPLLDVFHVAVHLQ